MFRGTLCCMALLLVTSASLADASSEGDDKLISGMSIVGDDEAPKSLVIVPWKSSELGGRLAVSRLLDDGRQPVDRDVFMRELRYYRIRTESSGSRSTPTP